jgi:DNA-binding MarR family transcriptional regulator
MRGGAVIVGKKREITQQDYERLAAFRHQLRLFLHFSEEGARRVGLTFQQHQALLAIKGFTGRENATIGELAESLQIKPHSAVGLVDRLAAQNLVERQQGIEDRRKVYLTLTERGSELLAEISTANLGELQRISAAFQVLMDNLK